MASSSTSRPAGASVGPGEKSYFEQQRDALVQEIALSLEHVLMNINKLNRNLEGVLAVGKEFDSVEALWSQFENVMARDEDEEGNEEGTEGDEAEEGEEEEDTTMREDGGGGGR